MTLDLTVDAYSLSPGLPDLETDTFSGTANYFLSANLVIFECIIPVTYNSNHLTGPNTPKDNVRLGIRATNILPNLPTINANVAPVFQILPVETASRFTSVSGNIAAVREVMDRVEGKAVAIQEISGVDGEPLTGIQVTFVKPNEWRNKISHI